MSKITISVSPITNTIYAGRLNKAGNMWVGVKHDVTDEAINSAMQHIYQKAIDNDNELEELFIRDFNGYELKLSATKINEQAK